MELSDSVQEQSITEYLQNKTLQSICYSNDKNNTDCTDNFLLYYSEQ